MTLLQEIQEAATDPKVDILTLLRKCRILAARLKNGEFKNWVQSELDGYPKDDAIPEYRKAPARSKGHFFGPFGRQLNHAEIPLSSIPEEYAKYLKTIEFRQGIGPLLDLVNSGNSEFKMAWSPDLYSIVGGNIFEDMQLMQAWIVVPKGAVVNVIETVRNKVLNFVLEIEAMNPEAGEASSKNTPLPNQQVTQVFNQNIYGNVGNLASGGSNFQQTANVTVTYGDFRSLRNELLAQGVAEPDILELEQAVQSDPTPKDAKFGTKVSGWFGKMVSKAASGAWKVSTDVAAKVLSEALCAYYGVGKP